MLKPLRPLFVLNKATLQPGDFGATKLFGERISAFIIDGKTYQLTLANLKYNDANSFQLEVGIMRYDSIKMKRATMHLLVEGMVNAICFF